MTVPVKTQNSRIGDIVKFLEEAIYCIESYKLVNPKASEYTYPVGTPVSVSGVTATPLAAAAAASTVALLLEEVTVPASSTTPLANLSFLVRGPACVDIVNLPDTDYAGASYNKTTIGTALAALSPKITTKAEPTQLERQES